MPKRTTKDDPRHPAPAAVVPSTDASVGRRALLTLLFTGLYLAGRWIPAPGIDRAVLGSLRTEPGWGSLSRLGIHPVVGAWLLVEVAASIVPTWRALRHSGPVARAKLDVLAILLLLPLSLVFASLEATRLARAVPGVDLFSDAHGGGLYVATVAAYAFFSLACAQWISRQGLVSGVVVLLVAEWGLDIVMHRPATVTIPLEPSQARALIGAALLSVAATLAIAPWKTVFATQRQRFDAHALALPLGSIAPWLLALALLDSLVPNLASLRIRGAETLASRLSEGATWPFVALALTLILGVAFAVGSHRPSVVVQTLARVSVATTKDAVAAATWRALPATLLMLGCLAFADIIFASQPSYFAGVGLSLAPVAVGILLDTIVSWRTFRTRRGWTPVWREQRPYLVEPILDLLARDEIDARAHGVMVARLLGFLGPFAPAVILVPGAQARAAIALLEGRLARPSADVPASSLVSWQFPARATGSLLLPFVLGGWAAWHGYHTFDPGVATPAATRTASFELVRVDDAADLAPRSDESVPRGVSPQLESGFGSDGEIGGRALRIVARDSETLAEVRQRFLAFLDHIELPRGRRIVLGDLTEYDENDQETVVGYRTYVVYGEPLVTPADVERVDIRPGPDGRGAVLDVKIRPELAPSLERATRDHRGRRLAIVVDGRVTSAPRVTGAIKGGTLWITLGQHDPVAQLRAAEALAATLRGR